jgi:hypothetical protein
MTSSATRRAVQLGGAAASFGDAATPCEPALVSTVSVDVRTPRAAGGAVLERCAPVLVTGMPRAGTSWVGKMLEACGDFVYINEPLNPRHPPGQSPGVLRAPVNHRFQYISEANEHLYLKPFKDTLAFRYQFRAELRRNRSVPDLLRMVQHSASFAYGRIRARLPLVDDPYAVFSSGWFARRLGCQVVVVIRHPAALIASRRRLGWRTDFRSLLAQERLMADWLEPYRAEMEALTATDDALAEGALLWRMVHEAIRELEQTHPDLHVIRHEDLSRDPVRRFDELYTRLGLPFARATARQIEKATSGGRGERRVAWSLSRSGPSRTAYRPLDSRANATRWIGELSQDEVARIRALTGDVAASFYGDEDWLNSDR